MAGLFGDDGHRLDRGRSGADHADALAGEIDPFMRPVTGVIDLALEIGEALDIRHPRIRQAAGGEHDMFCRDGLAVGSGDLPYIGALVENSPIDAGVELDIATEIKTVGDVIGVLQDLGLRRVALAPVPILLQLVRERIGILHALDIAACAGIAIPVPGTADIAALLVDLDGQSQSAQFVQHVHSGKTRADHDDIVGLSACGVAFAGSGLQGGHVFALPWDSFMYCEPAFYPPRESARGKNAGQERCPRHSRHTCEGGYPVLGRLSIPSPTLWNTGSSAFG